MPKKAGESYFNSCSQLQQRIYLDITLFLQKQGLSTFSDMHCDLNLNSLAINVAHAREVALYSSNRQKDRRGRNYFYHLESVANMFSDPALKSVAYLHDVMEGSDTIDSTVLMNSGFHPVIVGAVVALTRPAKMSYKGHLDRILENPIAVVVKLAELMDNADVRALTSCTEMDFKRMTKYANAVKYIIQRCGCVSQVSAPKVEGLRAPADETTLM